nr:subtilisin-like protease SBT3.18 [Ipomoea batatas]
MIFGSATLITLKNTTLLLPLFPPQTHVTTHEPLFISNLRCVKFPMSTIMAATVVYLWALSLSVSLCVVHSMPTTHVYLVYLGHHQNQDPVLTSSYHLRLLATVFTSKEDAEEAMVYSYKHGLSGFSAKLNSSQAAALAGKKGVISVFKSKSLELHTTRSWDFLGLTLDYDSHGRIPLQLAHGDEIVVGVLDTGPSL